MPAKKKPDGECAYKVGDHVTVSLSGGQIVYATVKAIIDRTDGVRLLVDYEKDKAALVYLWQVHRIN